jgi:monooxygenase
MTTTAPVTTSEQGTEQIQDAGHVDVLIVGAGVSGIGAAHHLRERFADQPFIVLDAQDNRGGTWYTHRYPGGAIRQRPVHLWLPVQAMARPVHRGG